MQTRTTRACGIAAVGLLTALASYSAFAETPKTPRPETSLLGIRLLSGYGEVLRKFGQPNEIQVGEPTANGQAQTASVGRGMGGPPGMMGGPPGMMGGYPGGAGRQMGGYPGGSGAPPGMMMGPGGYPGGAGRQMGGYPGGSSAPPGMMMGPGGIPGMPGGKGGLPGMGGYPGSSGGPPGMMGGPGGYNANNANNTAEDPGETSWWYHFPRQGLHYSFLFNKDGKVIQIQAYGQKPAPKIVAPRSVLGITLGSDLGQVIRKYGWSNDGEHAGDYVVLRYGQTDRIAFQSRHNKVLGIVLGVINKEAENAAAAGGYPGGPGGYPGGPGGYPGGNGPTGGGGNE